MLEIIGPDGEVADLVAWYKDDLATWWLGDFLWPFLGIAEVEKAQHFDVPLLLHETPADWLAAHDGGYWPAACLLDWRAPIRFWLSDVRRIIPGTAAIARRLAEHFDSARMPHFTSLPRRKVAA